eukprot:COSAG01_NODE_63011_length_281_cov_43.368132_1_plen_50_part_01
MAGAKKSLGDPPGGPSKSLCRCVCQLAKQLQLRYYSRLHTATMTSRLQRG